MLKMYQVSSQEREYFLRSMGEGGNFVPPPTPGSETQKSPGRIGFSCIPETLNYVKRTYLLSEKEHNRKILRYSVN